MTHKIHLNLIRSGDLSSQIPGESVDFTRSKYRKITSARRHKLLIGRRRVKGQATWLTRTSGRSAAAADNRGITGQCIMLDTRRPPAFVSGVIKIYDTQTIASLMVLLLLGARLHFLPQPPSYWLGRGAIYTGHVLLHISLSPYAPWQANRAGMVVSLPSARACVRSENEDGVKTSDDGAVLPVFVWPDLDFAAKWVAAGWQSAKRKLHSLYLVNFIWPDTKTQWAHNLTPEAVVVGEWYFNLSKQYLPKVDYLISAI